MPGPRLRADDLVELHGRSGQRFAALVAGVGPEQWHNGTPCSEWDVRTLVHHLLYEQRWVPPLFEGLTIEQVGEQFEGDLMGDNASAWPGLLASSTEEAHSAVAQAGALDRTVHLSFGDVSVQEYVMQLTADLAIHAWDHGSHPADQATTSASRPGPQGVSDRGPEAARLNDAPAGYDTGRTGTGGDRDHEQGGQRVGAAGSRYRVDR